MHSPLLFNHLLPYHLLLRRPLLNNFPEAQRCKDEDHHIEGQYGQDIDQQVAELPADHQASHCIHGIG